MAEVILLPTKRNEPPKTLTKEELEQLMKARQEEREYLEMLNEAFK